VSSHTSGCPFRSFASRWSKVMHQGGSKAVHCVRKSKRADIITEENNSEYLMNRVSEVLSDSKTNFYVPPYFLSLSDEFLRFEDCTGDGSITRDRVKEGALQIRDKLRARLDGGSKIDVKVPDAVTIFCRKVLPDADIDNLLYQKENMMKVPYLLSTFGWAPCEGSVGEKAGVIVKCRICQAKIWLASSLSTDEETFRKRRRIDTKGDATLKLIDSHRVYCPYVSGFSFGPGRQSDLPGWKVVVSNLLRSTTHTSVGGNSECEQKFVNKKCSVQ